MSAVSIDRDVAADTIAEFLQRIVESTPELPAMAVAVVRNGDVVFAGAAGFADRAAGRQATAETPFYIASSTKSFTGLAASMLAARGALNLDSAITTYIPELELPRAIDPRSVTLRNLLTHSVPLVNNPIVLRTAYTGEHSPEELIALLRSSETRKAGFEYDNLGYVVAGLVMERVTGQPWQRVLDSLIFRPLGMRHTSAYMSAAETWGVATPYRAGEPVRPKTDATMHAAGGVVTSANDMARWLTALLEGGRVAGRQVIPQAPLDEALRMQVNVEQRGLLYQPFGYALGWNWAKRNSDTVLYHFGGYAGARAHVSFVPSRGIGVAVLLNASGRVSESVDIVAEFAYDVLMGRADRRTVYDSLLVKLRNDVAAAATRREEEERAIAARPRTLTLPAAAYAGTYRNAQLGTLRIRAIGDSLTVTAGVAHATAGNFTRPNTIRVELDQSSGQVIRFLLDGSRVTGLQFADLTFTRVSDSPE